MIEQCSVAIKMVAQLSTNNQQRPDRLVLESPFNNISAVFRTHPLTRVDYIDTFRHDDTCILKKGLVLTV